MARGFEGWYVMTRSYCPCKPWGGMIASPFSEQGNKDKWDNNYLSIHTIQWVVHTTRSCKQQCTWLSLIHVHTTHAGSSQFFNDACRKAGEGVPYKIHQMRHVRWEGLGVACKCTLLRLLLGEVWWKDSWFKQTWITRYRHARTGQVYLRVAHHTKPIPSLHHICDELYHGLEFFCMHHWKT